MLHQKNKAEVSKFDKSHEDNLPVETTASEVDVSNSVIVDAGKETNPTLVGCNKVDKNKIDAAEEEHMYGEHATEEIEMGLRVAKEEEEPDDDDDNGEGGEEEETDEYDDDNGDDVNVDDDEEPDEYDDDEDSDNEDFDEDDDYDDYDDENDDMMEEGEIDENAKLENNDDTVEQSDDSQRNKVEEGKKQENAKEENEEREDGSLKKKVKILRKGIERKKFETEVSDKLASKSRDKQEEDGQGDAMEEADQRNEKEDIQDKEGSHKQKVKKLSKSRSSKAAAGGFKKVTSRRDDKVESWHRKKSSKKVESMGMIFMCSSKTKRDCYHYKVLGLPANKRDVVGQIYKGMRLFLYDFDRKLMYGIYKAAGPGGYNIQPRAFNSQFPSQVRFTVLEDCLPLAEEKFKKVIKDNYYTKTKFDCQLTSQQVKNLCKLFVSASKGAKSKVLARRLKTRVSTDQDRSRARERQSAVDERRLKTRVSIDQDRPRARERQSAGDEKRPYQGYSSKRKREMVASPVPPVPRLILPPAAAASAVDEKCQYWGYSSKRKRDMVASPVPPVPRLLLPPAAATPSYAYDRTLEMDPYRRDLFVEHLDANRQPVPEPCDAYRTAQFLEHRDVYRTEPTLDHIGSYRRDVAVEHLDLRIRDEIGRHDPYISYRERPEHRDLRSQDDYGRRDRHFYYKGSPENLNLRSQDEIGRRDPYISYRARLAYRDPVYGTGPLPEDDHYRPVSQSSYYCSAEAPVLEYRAARPLRRY